MSLMTHTYNPSPPQVEAENHMNSRTALAAEWNPILIKSKEKTQDKSSAGTQLPFLLCLYKHLNACVKESSCSWNPLEQLLFPSPLMLKHFKIIRMNKGLDLRSILWRASWMEEKEKRWLGHHVTNCGMRAGDDWRGTKPPPKVPLKHVTQDLLPSRFSFQENSLGWDLISVTSL